MRITIYASPKKCISCVCALQQCASRVYDGLLKCASPFLWVFQKFASRFMKVINNRISFVWALQQCASRFYEGLTSVRLLFFHLLFMILSRNCITIYEGLSSLHLLCMSVSKMCITVLWRSSQHLHLRCMSVSKMRITIYEGPKKCISVVCALQQCAARFYAGL